MKDYHQAVGEYKATLDVIAPDAWPAGRTPTSAPR